jgi:hypothetical protein
VWEVANAREGEGSEAGEGEMGSSESSCRKN